jgi:hypothetical protein
VKVLAGYKRKHILISFEAIIERVIRRYQTQMGCQECSHLWSQPTILRSWGNLLSGEKVTSRPVLPHKAPLTMAPCLRKACRRLSCRVPLRCTSCDGSRVILEVMPGGPIISVAIPTVVRTAAVLNWGWESRKRPFSTLDLLIWFSLKWHFALLTSLHNLVRFWRVCHDFARHVLPPLNVRHAEADNDGT